MFDRLSRKLRMADTPAGGSAGLLGGAAPAAPAPDNLPTPSTGGDPAPAPAPSSWTEGFDPDTAALVTAKGWKGPLDALQSYRNLEKMLGGEKLPVPKSAEDKDAWNGLYKAIGRPEAATGYELDKIEGIDPATASKFAELAHANGLSVQAAQALAKFDLERSTAAQEAQAKATEAALAADAEKLRQEWGQNFDANKEAAARAFKHSGLTAEEVASLDRSIGMARTMELFASFGKTMLEAKPIGFGGDGSTGMGAFSTPEGAAAEIARMKSDPTIAKALFDGDTTARAKFAALQKIAYQA